jgi:hypothetical protein
MNERNEGPNEGGRFSVTSQNQPGEGMATLEHFHPYDRSGRDAALLPVPLASETVRVRDPLSSGEI